MSGQFGNTGIGASWLDSGVTYKYGNKLGPIPAGKTYRLSSPQIYMRGKSTVTGTQSLKLILWDDGATPGNVIMVGTEAFVTGGGGGGTATTAAWIPFSFTGGATTFDLTAGGSDRYFWFGVIDTGADNAAQLAADVGAAGSNQYKADAGYGTIAVGNAFGTPDGSGTEVFSMRVTYDDVTLSQLPRLGIHLTAVRTAATR